MENNKKALIIASVGISLAVISTIVIFSSDFGCQIGNVGNMGLDGPTGVTGIQGQTGQVVFSTTPDLTLRELSSGYTQPSFKGNLLQDNKNGFGISSWLFSMYIPTTSTTVELSVLNNGVQLAMTPTNKITVALTGLVVNRREEINIVMYFWRESGGIFKVACPFQSTLFTGKIEDWENANMAFRLKCFNTPTYNRNNYVHVYNNTAVNNEWCL
jgi:hypothetical protein